ncbi:MAG TPA: glycosyltransferase [Myxococcota bacterium]|nr:glycosyltransferase [Myxococcota bacterium]
MKVGLVILNRNEEEALPHILPRLPRDAVDVTFAIDGKSTDASPRLLEEAGIGVVGQSERGRGAAFAEAFRYIGDRVDALIFFSPDGNEAPDDIRRFRPLLEGGADMVIASRMMAGAVNEEDASLWRPRKWANLAFREAARGVWGRGKPRITDPINGFRAITRRAWALMRPDALGYTIEYQTSIRAYKYGLRVVEFPTIEGQRLGGVSGAPSIPTGLRFVRQFVAELRA